MLIGSQYVLSPSKCRYQHQQSRFRKMKVRQQSADYAKLEARVDKDVRFPRTCRNRSATLQRSILQRANCSGAYGHNAPLFFKHAIDLGSAVCRNRKRLAVHLMSFNLFRMHRLKRSQPDVQRDLGYLDSPQPDFRQSLRSEVESGRWSRNAPPIPRIDSLVTFAVLQFVLSGNIGWQGDMSKAFHQ